MFSSVKALHSLYYHFGALYTWWSFSLFGNGAFFHPKLDEGGIKIRTCLHSKRIEPCALEGGQVENQEGGDQGS